MRAVDITGQVFGKLTAIVPTGQSTANGREWLCACECGRDTAVVAKNLRSGNTKSCGCIARAVVVDRNRANATHGMTESSTFTVWVNMIQRCTNENHVSYHRYGGRGIKVCDRWIDSFEAFLEDMGERPESMQLDRRDNDLGYSRDNCRWVTVLSNANNRENSRRVTHLGRSLTIAEWAREIGCSRQALRHRLNSDWSVKDALETPFNHANRWRKRSENRIRRRSQGRENDARPRRVPHLQASVADQPRGRSRRRSRL